MIIWGEKPGFAEVPMDRCMEISLKEPWKAGMKKSQKKSPYILKAPRRGSSLIKHLINYISKVEWSTHWSILLAGYLVFVAHTHIPKADGSVKEKGCVILDIHGLNAQVKPDLYQLPSQEELIGAGVQAAAYETRQQIVVMILAYLQAPFH